MTTLKLIFDIEDVETKISILNEKKQIVMEFKAEDFIKAAPNEEEWMKEIIHQMALCMDRFSVPVIRDYLEKEDALIRRTQC